MSTANTTFNMTSLRSYVSKNGNDTFVYTVDANEKQKEVYKAAAGDNYREDESGKPLFFTTRFAGDKAKLMLTQNNRLVVDTSDFKKANSLVKQYGGNLGTEMAKIAASSLLGTSPGEPAASAPAEVAAPVAGTNQGE